MFSLSRLVNGVDSHFEIVHHFEPPSFNLLSLNEREKNAKSLQLPACDGVTWDENRTCLASPSTESVKFRVFSV